MAAPHLSTMLLTAEEYSILTRANASFSGKIEKCFNVSFSSSERERCQQHRTASANFTPCDPDSIRAPEFLSKENELNRTKSRLDVLEISVWNQAVNRFKLTGCINGDVRRCLSLSLLCINSFPLAARCVTYCCLNCGCTLTLHCVQVLQSGDAVNCVAEDV
jgi:hypothetical protein